jgi:histidinol-phosphate aminotransferase
MRDPQTVSRRGFVGRSVATLGVLALTGDASLPAQQTASAVKVGDGDYDAMAKLGNNENPWGPPDSVVKAMTDAFKYANRYGYPDGDIQAVIAKHHGVKPENVLLGAGSGEILNVVCGAFLEGDRNVVGAEPSYNVLYQHATALRHDVIKVPLLADFRQDIPAMIRATRQNHRDVGFVYLCNPNNPTGRVVPKREVAQLLDGIPEDVPVLIDEAYHHFVEDPSYATSVPWVIDGRQVIIARTFSKIAALAGMRLGYAVAPAELVRKMRPYQTGTINAVVKWGAVAALQDTASQARVKRMTIALREQATGDLAKQGYDVIPSDANFFMVHIRQPVPPVIEAFKKKGVIVGRAFPPMMEHLRVSIGTAEEMGRFMTAFREIVPAMGKTAKAG